MSDTYTARDRTIDTLLTIDKRAYISDIPPFRWTPGGWVGDGRSRKTNPHALLRMITGQCCSDLEVQAGTVFGVVPRAVRNWWKALVRTGLVRERHDQSDRRRKTLTLTPLGQTIAAKWFEPWMLTCLLTPALPRIPGAAVDTRFRFSTARAIGLAPWGQEEVPLVGKLAEMNGLTKATIYNALHFMEGGGDLVFWQHRSKSGFRERRISITSNLYWCLGVRSPIPPHHARDRFPRGDTDEGSQPDE